MSLFKFLNPFQKKDAEKSEDSTAKKGFSGTTHRQRMFGSSNQDLNNWLNQSPNPSATLQDPLALQNNMALGDTGNFFSSTSTNLNNQTTNNQLSLNFQSPDKENQIDLRSNLRTKGIPGQEDFRLQDSVQAGVSTREDLGNGQLVLGGQGTANFGQNNGPVGSLRGNASLSQTDDSGHLWNGSLQTGISSKGNKDWNTMLSRSKDGAVQSLTAGSSGVGANISKSRSGESSQWMLNGSQVRSTNNNLSTSANANMNNGTFQMGGRMSHVHSRNRLSIGNTDATWNLLDAAGSASMLRNDKGIRANANAKFEILNANMQHDLFDLDTPMFGEDMGLEADVKANTSLGAQGKGSLSFDNGVSGQMGAFAGAKATVGTEGAVTWDRKSSYTDVLRDHFDNFPGTWDDQLVDKIPESWMQKGSDFLFGKGKTRLVTGSAGVDARAGVGAEAGFKATRGEDGLLEMGGNVGLSAGVGGGGAFHGGVNPVAIGRLGILKGMETVNSGYTGAQNLGNSMKERAAQDAAIVGAQLEAQKEKGGLLGGASQLLLDIDNAIRGKNKE